MKLIDLPSASAQVQPATAAGAMANRAAARSHVFMVPTNWGRGLVERGEGSYGRTAAEVCRCLEEHAASLLSTALEGIVCALTKVGNQTNVAGAALLPRMDGVWPTEM